MTIDYKKVRKIRDTPCIKMWYMADRTLKMQAKRLSKKHPANNPTDKAIIKMIESKSFVAAVAQVKKDLGCSLSEVKEYLQKRELWLPDYDWIPYL